MKILTDIIFFLQFGPSTNNMMYYKASNPKTTSNWPLSIEGPLGLSLPRYLEIVHVQISKYYIT